MLAIFGSERLWNTLPQVSTMSFFEIYRSEIPIFVPSVKLLEQWILVSIMVSITVGIMVSVPVSILTESMTESISLSLIHI